MSLYDDEPTILGHGRPGGTLVIRQGPQAGMSFPLTGGEVIIGREEGIGIVLQDPESSRRHARVVMQADRYIVEDLGSTNGTFVNGVQLTGSQVLNPGDSIGIGQTALVFQLAGVQVAPPQYQPAPQYQQAPPPALKTGGDNKLTQYALYGCGCLLLAAICALLAVAAWIILNPDSLEGLGMVTWYPETLLIATGIQL